MRSTTEALASPALGPGEGAAAGGSPARSPRAISSPGRPIRQGTRTPAPGKIEGRILLVRGEKVMLDSDLAKLYGIPTRRLNEQVRRNRDRFPDDFMFQLTPEESAALRSQDATSTPGRGGRRYAPLVFTEQGVAMLSSVLHSERAVRVNVEIMRAFVRLRAMAYAYTDLAHRIRALERKYDAQFRDVFDAIRALMAPPPGRARRRIGFRPPPEGRA